MNFACPHCHQPLEADESYAGATVDCPACGKPFVIAVAPAEPVPPVAVASPVQESYASQKPGQAGRKKKKWIWLLAVLAVLALVGTAFFCFGGMMENIADFSISRLPKNDAGFLKKLQKGVEARQRLSEKLSKSGNPLLLPNSEKRERQKKLINVELNAIGDLSAYTFEDKTLQSCAEAYYGALQSELKAIPFLGADAQEYDKLFNLKGRRERAKLICRFVDEYRLAFDSEDVELLIFGRKALKEEYAVRLTTQLPAKLGQLIVISQEYWEGVGVMRIRDYEYSNCMVEDFAYQVKYENGKAIVELSISGRKVDDSNGPDFSRECAIGWKLYKGAFKDVVDSGRIVIPELRADEKFNNATAWIWDLAPGNYSLELINARD